MFKFVCLKFLCFRFDPNKTHTRNFCGSTGLVCSVLPHSFAWILYRLGHEAAHPLGGVFLHLVCDMGVGVQREPRAVVAQDAGYCFGVYALLDGQGCERMPLWHNKDKSENPCVATGWLVCPYSFSTKNGPEMGSAGGGEKLGLHLKDKFF